MTENCTKVDFCKYKESGRLLELPFDMSTSMGVALLFAN